MNGDNAFLGSGWAFPPRFTRRGVTMAHAERDIEESLFILLSTVPGERVMQPTFGCGLKLHVFDGVNESTIAAMKDIVGQAILFHEPRVVVERIDVSDVDLMEGKLAINVHYKVRATNNRYNLVYPFYFNEGTNVSV
ncbi:MAG: GPW/gp25 family protein [Gammaproteobacteria bacterium]